MTHRTTFASRLRVLTGIALVGLLSACSTIDRGTAPALEANASWAVLPFENHTETPMAGNRAAAIATALINARGVGQVKRYTGDALQETLFDGREAKRRDDALAWARGEGVRYALTGAVDEWRYKVGVGGERPIHVHDPLVRQALDSHVLCHVSQSMAEGQQTQYIVVAPMLDLEGEIYGLLLVEEMPFFALQEEALQTINLLLGYYTDSVAANSLAAPLLQAYPDCPPHFAFELQRMEHVNRSARLSSVVVALELSPSAVQAQMAQQIMRLERMLDRSWLQESDGRQLLAIFMPLGTNATAEGYLNRIEGWLAQRGVASLADAGIFPRTILLDRCSASSVLERLHQMGQGHA